MRLFVQLSKPVSNNNPMSFPSVPELLAGPAAMVKFSKGLSVQVFTEAWSTICGSWLATLPPASALPFNDHGAGTSVLNVILLLNVLFEQLDEALR